MSRVIIYDLVNAGISGIKGIEKLNKDTDFIIFVENNEYKLSSNELKFINIPYSISNSDFSESWLVTAGNAFAEYIPSEETLFYIISSEIFLVKIKNFINDIDVNLFNSFHYFNSIDDIFTSKSKEIRKLENEKKRLCQELEKIDIEINRIKNSQKDNNPLEFLNNDEYIDLDDKRVQYPNYQVRRKASCFSYGDIRRV